MRRSVALLLLPVLATAAACEDQPWHPGLEAELATQPPPRCTEPASEVVPAPSPVPEPDAPTYLVWQQLSTPTYAEAETVGPRYETAWVRAGDDGPEVLGTTSGLLVTHGTRVYRWVSEPVEFRAISCAGMDTWTDEDTPDSAFHTVLDRASRLVPLDGGPSIAVHGAQPGKVEDAIEEHDRTLLVTGTVGPYLFTESYLYTYNCGAHGGVQATAGVLDLRTGLPVELAPAVDHARFAAVWPQLRTALLREDPDETWFAPDGPEDVRLTALQPRVQDGRIRIDHQLTVDTCYACSDGDWSSYTLSVQLPLEAPPGLEPYLSVPTAVSARLGEETEGLTRGFTAVTTGAAHATVRDAFAPAV